MIGERIFIMSEGCGPTECSLGEFLSANDCLDFDELADIVATVDRGEIYTGGGGAQPIFQVRQS